MKTWMLPWLFPVGLLGTVVFVVVFKGYAALIALPLGWVLIPVLWYARSRRGALGGTGDLADSETHYWRITRP
jgi:hypothetical protein